MKHRGDIVLHEREKEGKKKNHKALSLWKLLSIYVETVKKSVIK